MKILIVHNLYQSRNIGGEDVVYRQEVTALREKLGVENVLTYEVSNDEIHKLSLIFSIWFSWKHFFGIRKIVRTQGISVVHVHNVFPLLTPSVFVAARIAGAKVIHTLHNFRWWCVSGIFYREKVGACELCAKKKYPLSGIRYRCYRNSLSQTVLAQTAHWFYHRMNFLRFVDQLIVLTPFQREKVLELGIASEKITLKPNFMQMSKIEDQPRNGFLYVGRLEEAKGVRILLNTWKELSGEYKLTIIGEGELESEIKKANLSNVKFLGKVSREEVLRQMGIAKYLIQPSLLYETFGLTILEAMSLGTPVIGFAIGTRPGFIRDGENGFLALSENFRKVVEHALDYKNYEQLGGNARETAKKYSLEAIIERQIEIYKSL